MTPLEMRPSALREPFGDIDIYLFDQLLRGRIGDDATVLDAGCGAGRNLVFMMRPGMNVFGIEDQVRSLGARRHVLPDGSTRFLVDAAYLMPATNRLGGTLLDPLKTTVVQGMRAMTTWVLHKT